MLELPRHPLRRYYGDGDYHFIITSCYRRQPLLGSAQARDIFLAVLELAGKKYRFDVIGYVVMPEHAHWLISEPEKRNPSVVMQVLKQEVARRLLRRSRGAEPLKWIVSISTAASSAASAEIQTDVGAATVTNSLAPTG